MSTQRYWSDLAVRHRLESMPPEMACGTELFVSMMTCKQTDAVTPAIKRDREVEKGGDK